MQTESITVQLIMFISSCQILSCDFRTHYNVLTPNDRFRMRQVNIVGTSLPSQPSRKIQTLPAPPDMAPANVTLRTASETSLWLRWMVSRKLLILSKLSIMLDHDKMICSKESGLF